MCRYEEQQQEGEERRNRTENTPFKDGGASSDGRKKTPSKKRKKKTYHRVVRKVKRRARSELRISKGDWTRHGYGTAMLSPSQTPHDSMHIVDGRTVSFAEFSHCIEKKGLPCLIKNVCDHWPAMHGQWSDASLLRRYKDYSFKVGSDDDGFAVRMKLHHFLKYARDPKEGVQDDSPLYIFDGSVLSETARDGSCMMQDYTVPFMFSEDLLRLAGEDKRPPWRWFCAGGARSGTCIHMDPLGTSAWNALIRGHKRWVLFPPGTPKEAIKPKGVDSAIRWFDIVWPKTLKKDWGYARPIHVIQGPGETVYVPQGWWHVVLNLDFTVAVTHNFCSSANFRKVFMHCRISRPKMTQRWLKYLRLQRPDLAEIAQHIVDDDERCDSISSASSSSSSSCCSSSSSDGDSTACSS